MEALIANARFHFHKKLFENNTLTLTTAGVASNADTSSRGSKAISRKIVDILVEEQNHAVSTVDKISGQTLGKQFETLTMEFLRETFPNLQNLRPGNWTILQLGNNNKLKTSDFIITLVRNALEEIEPSPTVFLFYEALQIIIRNGRIIAGKQMA